MKINFLIVVFGGILLLAVACNHVSKTPTWDEQFYRERGLEISGITQNAMSTQLKKALEEGGVPNAIQYCNLAAYPIADSLSKIYDATIRRVTDKPRNPSNTLSVHEQDIFNRFKTQAIDKQQIEPVIEQLQNGEIAFYAPIRIQALCTKCHGKLGETLTAENDAVIQHLYPADQAIGYGEGDLRGMWSIVMKAKEQE